MKLVIGGLAVMLMGMYLTGALNNVLAGEGGEFLQILGGYIAITLGGFILKKGILKEKKI